MSAWMSLNFSFTGPASIAVLTEHTPTKASYLPRQDGLEIPLGRVAAEASGVSLPETFFASLRVVMVVSVEQGIAVAGSLVADSLASVCPCCVCSGVQVPREGGGGGGVVCLTLFVGVASPVLDPDGLCPGDGLGSLGFLSGISSATLSVFSFPLLLSFLLLLASSFRHLLRRCLLLGFLFPLLCFPSLHLAFLFLLQALLVLLLAPLCLLALPWLLSVFWLFLGSFCHLLLPFPLAGSSGHFLVSPSFFSSGSRLFCSLCWVVCSSCRLFLPVCHLLFLDFVCRLVFLPWCGAYFSWGRLLFLLHWLFLVSSFSGRLFGSFRVLSCSSCFFFSASVFGCWLCFLPVAPPSLLSFLLLLHLCLFLLILGPLIRLLVLALVWVQSPLLFRLASVYIDDCPGTSGAAGSVSDVDPAFDRDVSELPLAKGEFSKSFHEVIALITTYFPASKPSESLHEVIDLITTYFPASKPSVSSEPDSLIPWLDDVGDVRKRCPRVFLNLFEKLAAVHEEVNEKFLKAADKTKASSSLPPWSEVCCLGNLYKFDMAPQVNECFSQLPSKPDSSRHGEIEACVRGQNRVAIFLPLGSGLGL